MEQLQQNFHLHGSFGHGLQRDMNRLKAVTAPLDSVGVLGSFEEAQAVFDAYTASTLETLIGTPISKSGFF